MKPFIRMAAICMILGCLWPAVAGPNPGVTRANWDRVEALARLARQSVHKGDGASWLAGTPSNSLFSGKLPLADLLGAVKTKEDPPALMVGDDPVDETLVLTADQFIDGEIVVMNQGTLVIDGCRVQVAGNVVVAHDAVFQVTDGTLAFHSSYRYEHSIFALNDATVDFSYAQVTSNGYSMEGTFTDQAQFLVADSSFESVITTGLLGSASADVQRSNPLEWVLDENCRLHLTDAEGPFMLWPMFPDGSVADLTFPDGSHVASFEISDARPDVSGLGLIMSLENVSNVSWGLLLRTGSDVTVRDSNMRTTGFLLDQGAAATVTGLVNGQSFVDTEVPVEGVRYRLVNSRVDTWNLYGWGVTELSIDNCLFGELGVLDRTDAFLTNCLIDGSGGYLFTGSDTETLLILTSLTSDTIANDESVQFFAYSTITNGDIVASNQSIVVLLNTVAERQPQARDGGLAVDLNIVPPPAPTTEALLPIEGNAFMAAGPALGISSAEWQLFYGEGDGSSGWIPITPPRQRLLRNGLLDVWDTRGLAPGTYTLRLSMTLEGGFSVETERQINLGAPGPVTDGIVFVPHVAWSPLWQSWLVADNTGSMSHPVSLYVYREGELVRVDTVVVEAGDQVRLPLLEGGCGLVTAGPDVVLREVFLHNLEAGMAAFLLDGTAGTTRHFLLSGHGDDSLTWSGMAVMNPGSVAVAGQMRAIGLDGGVVAQAELTVGARTRTVGVLESFFPGIDRSIVARVDVEMDGPVTGLVISGVGNEKLLFTAAIDMPALDGVIIPHLANNWDRWDNRLTLDNLGDEPATVQLVLYREGTRVVDTTLDVAAGASRLVSLNDYAGLGPTMGMVIGMGEPVSARLTYQSIVDGGMAEFVLSGRMGDTADFLFPGQFVDTINWMGMAVASSDTVSADVALTAWREGVLVATESVQLGPHTRLVDVIESIFSTVGPTGLDRIRVTADHPILSGVAISGFNQERLLFTPAVVDGGVE